MYSFLLSMLNYINSKVLTVIFSFSLSKKMDFILYSATLVLYEGDFNRAFEIRNLNSIWISQSTVCIHFAWNPDPVKSMAKFPLTSKGVGFHTQSPLSFFFSLSAFAKWDLFSQMDLQMLCSVIISTFFYKMVRVF